MTTVCRCDGCLLADGCRKIAGPRNLKPIWLQAQFKSPPACSHLCDRPVALQVTVLHLMALAVHQQSELMLRLIKIAYSAGGLAEHSCPQNSSGEKYQDANGTLDSTHGGDVSIANGYHGVSRVPVYCLIRSRVQSLPSSP